MRPNQRWIATSRNLQCFVLAAAFVAACPVGGAAPVIMAKYEAGDGTSSWSPQYHWGWLSSWGEAWPLDQYGYSVTGAAGGGRNAWQIADAATGGVNPHYFFDLPAAVQQTANPYYGMARERGWRITTEAQFVSTMGGSANQGLSVYFDNRLYQVMIDHDASGDLRAQVYGNSTPYLLVTGAAAGDYYDYELRYDPATQQVTFEFEGQSLHTWSGVAAVHENLFSFGSLTSSGRGKMNYRSVLAEILAPALAPTQMGDYNGDGRVDLSDYTVWRQLLGSASPLADGNGNGRVDVPDYDVWKQNFGRDLGGGLQAQAAVPEPTTGALAVATLAAVCWLGKRKRAGMRNSQTDPVRTPSGACPY